MTSELRSSTLVATIDLIENSRNTQETIDCIYDNLCEIILNVCLFVCLFGVFPPTREFLTHLETSPLPVKGCKF